MPKLTEASAAKVAAVGAPARTSQALAAQLGETVSDFATKTAESLGLGVGFDVTDPEVQNYIRFAGGNKIVGINNTTRDAIRATLLEGLAKGENHAKLRKRIQTVFNVRRSRANTIARTEVGTASNYGSYIGMREAVENREWLSTQDNVVRNTHVALDGVVKPMDEPFESSGAKSFYPGGFGVAAEDINCRCGIIANFDTPKPQPPPPGGPGPQKPDEVTPDPPVTGSRPAKPSARPVGTRPVTGPRPRKVAAAKADYEKLGTIDTDKRWRNDKDIAELQADISRRLGDAGFSIRKDRPRVTTMADVYGDEARATAAENRGVAGTAVQARGHVAYAKWTRNKFTSGSLQDRERAVHTVVHEVLHIQSPMNLSTSYRGLGIPMEEALVEAQARRITAQIVGRPEAIGISGSYGAWVDYMVRAIKASGNDVTQSLFQIYNQKSLVGRTKMFKKITGKTFNPPAK